jgi:hypothetical protein
MLSNPYRQAGPLRAKEALAAFEATKARTASGASWAQGNAGRFEVEHPELATLDYPTNPAPAPETKMPSSLKPYCRQTKENVLSQYYL